MTSFNQWCAGKAVDSDMRLALEAVWRELAELGCPEVRTGRLLSEIVESIPAPSYAGEDWDD